MFKCVIIDESNKWRPALMKKALALLLCILCCLTLCGSALADVPVYRIINNNTSQNGTAVYTLPSESSQRLAVYYNGVIV